VNEGDEAKGYARDESAFVVLTDEELESVRLESARTIDIESFVPVGSVDWIWYETPYYLTPDDKVGEEAYCVIRDAMRATGMMGVSRLVLHRREHAVLLKPRDRGIELWTLRYGADVRDPDELFRNVNRQVLDRLHQLAINTAGDDLRLPDHQLIAFAAHHFNKDRKLQLAAAKDLEGIRAAGIFHPQRHVREQFLFEPVRRFREVT